MAQGEHPTLVIDRLCKHHGIDPSALLSLLLSCLMAQHAMKGLRDLGAQGVPAEMEVYRKILGPDTPEPASLLEALTLPLKADRELALRHAEVCKSQGRDETPLLQEAKTAEVLLLIMQELMNGAELGGVAASLRIDDWLKRFGINPPPSDEAP